MTAPLPPDPADVTDGDRAKAAEVVERSAYRGQAVLTKNVASALAAERAAVTRPLLALAEELEMHAMTEEVWGEGNPERTGGVEWERGYWRAYHHAAIRLRAVAAVLGETGGGQ